MQYHLNPPPQGPLARLVAGIIAVFVLIGAVMLGMVAFLVIAGFVLLAGLVIWLRVAWIKRRLKKQGVNLGEGEIRDPSGHVIDAEYTIVEDPAEQSEGQNQNQR
jgi:membrane protein implicated in regulation of membrane protease activity